MSAGDYRSFSVDLREPSSLDEIVEAMVEHKTQAIEEQLAEKNEQIQDLESEVEGLKVILSEVQYGQ